MLHTLKIKLFPSKKQYQKLLKTMENYNKACNYVSEIAFEAKVFSKIRLQKFVYYKIRGNELGFNLPSQLAITCVRKVSEIYKGKENRKEIKKFEDYEPVLYDSRIYSYSRLEKFSLATVEGREKVTMMVKDYVNDVVMKNRIRGQGDLILDNGEWWFYAVEDLVIKERKD